MVKCKNLACRKLAIKNVTLQWSRSLWSNGFVTNFRVYSYSGIQQLETQFLLLTNLSLEVLWSVGILYILCHLNTTENKAWNGTFKLRQMLHLVSKQPTIKTLARHKRVKIKSPSGIRLIAPTQKKQLPITTTVQPGLFRHQRDMLYQ